MSSANQKRGPPHAQDDRLAAARLAHQLSIPRTRAEALEMFKRGEIDMQIRIRSGAFAGRSFVVRMIDGKEMATHEVVSRGSPEAKNADTLIDTTHAGVPFSRPVPRFALETAVHSSDELQ